jgi:hypothetical protein
MGKAIDQTKLGRWVWVRYRGRNNYTLQIFSAYHPNPPSWGPLTVYAQHHLLSIILMMTDNEERPFWKTYATQSRRPNRAVI